MTFRLVAPSVWRSVLQESEFGIVEPRLAAAILVSLQDAHAGITPRLAEGLAVAITRRSGKAASVWDRLFANLVDSLLDAPLSGEMPGARRSASPFGLFAGANRLATILQVAQPLILEACATCRRTFLLCGEEARGSVTQQEYAKYTRCLDTTRFFAVGQALCDRDFVGVVSQHSWPRERLGVRWPSTAFADERAPISFPTPDSKAI